MKRQEAWERSSVFQRGEAGPVSFLTCLTGGLEKNSLRVGDNVADKT